MEFFLSRLKKDLIGYLFMVLLIWLVLGTELIACFIFLLFIYLFCDVVINDLGKFIPFIPKKLLFWTLYATVISLFIFFCIRIVPFLFTDLPHYTQVTINKTLDLLRDTALKYNLHVNFKLIRSNILENSTEAIGTALHIFSNFSKLLIYFIFALVLNFLLFQEKETIKNTFTHQKNSILAYLYEFMAARIQTFYKYFRIVMGGQVIISIINLLITAVVVTILNLPHKITLFTLIFFFGLIPVIGNVISNTILTITALISSGALPALCCLALLVGIHKLEYFLNSSIVGAMIHLPMFLTIATLLIGEHLLGPWGMIIAIPFFLTFIKELENP